MTLLNQPFRYLPTLAILLMLTSVTQAQTVLSGAITDAKTSERLPFANVYVSGTTKGTTADEFGQFRLGGLTESTVLLVVSAIGYEPYQQTLKPADFAGKPLNIALSPQAANLSEVAVRAKRDKSWERQLARFEDLFLGDSPNRAQCQILNPWVINFETGPDGVFRATASQPIDIENRALGYRLHYSLRDFSQSRTQVRINGTSLFEEMTATNGKDADRWQQGRQRTFTRSLRHFLYVLAHNQLNASNYTVYRMTQTDFGTTNVWNREKPFYTGTNVMDNEGLAKLAVSSPEVMPLNLSAPIEVIDNGQYVTLASQQVFNRNPISRLRALKPVVMILADGRLMDPTSVEVVGYWSEERIADMLPADYRFDGVSQGTGGLMQVQSTAYVATNKEVYRPGETIWLSAFLTDRRTVQPTPGTQPLYVALHDTTGAIRTTDVLFGGMGRAEGYLTVPDSLPDGTYWLRAYTKAMLRNPSLRFDKPLRITRRTALTPQWSDVPTGTLLTDTLTLQITPDKPTAGLRQRVTVRFRAEFAGQPMQGSFAVCVTDHDLTDVSGRYSLLRQREEPTAQKVTDTSVLSEVGLAYEGLVTVPKEEKSVPNATVTMLLRDSLRTASRVVRTDAKGHFRLDSLDLIGTHPLFYQIANRKGQPVEGSTLYLSRLTPPLNHPFGRPPVWVSRANRSRIWLTGQDGTAPDDTTRAKLLEEVTVTGKSDEPGLTRLHHDPTFAVDFGEQTPNFTNVMELLSGRLPGVQVLSYTDDLGMTNYRVLVRGISTWNNNDPLFLVDGVIIDIKQDRTLSFVNPNNVRRIEVISGANAAIYGSNGSNGVIAIYTRRGLNTPPDRTKTQSINLVGYQADRTFYQPDSVALQRPSPDLRQTLYWHPNLRTGRDGWVEFSFYTSDLPGQYAIFVEGMTPTGLPGRGVSLLTVKGK